MKIFTHYLSQFLLQIIFCTAAYSQLQTANWHFGSKTGLTFTTNPPSIVFNSALYSQEGSTSMSDASGNLLFYTSGDTIWNAQNLIMANGTGLFGDKSTTQSALAIKSQTNNSIYYLFTLDNDGYSDGLRYSIIDMSLAAGMGSVTVKNVPIYAPCLEKLAAVKHCNGVDYWIVSHEAATNNYRSYLLTSTGLNTTPIISSVGAIIANYSGGLFFGTAGQLKFSPTGKKMGAAMSLGSVGSRAELYDFNNATGVVSNSSTLAVSSTYCYGCEFSPDGTKFYANLDNKIVQWDLCAGSTNAIIASAYTVTNQNSGFQFQIANNGKIYIKESNNSLSLINNPNLAGAACNYIYQGQSLGLLSPNAPYIGLPAFAASSLVNFTHTQCLTSSTATFYPPTFANASSSCAIITNSVSSLSWNFGDPNSGSANTSSLNTPIHTFSQLGTFVVTLTINYVSCAPSVIIQTVNIASPTISIVQASATCNGLSSSTVSVSGPSAPYTYTWFPSLANTQVVNGVTGNYSVIASGGGCTISTSANIVSPLTVSASVQYTSSCTSATAAITVTNGSGIYYCNWSSVSQTNTLVTGIPAGLNTFTLNDLLSGCTLINTVQVSLLPSPTIAILGNFTICSGNSATLTATGANSYTWSGNNGNSSSIIVNPTSIGNYQVSGTNSLGCTGNQTVAVVISTPTIIVTGSTLICTGNNATLVASGANNYTWSNNSSNSATVVVSPTANTIYTVTGVNSFGCIKVKLVSVNVINTIPTVNVSGNFTICEGRNTTLTATGANNYTWSTNSVNVPSIIVSPTISTSYSVAGTNSTGCSGNNAFTITVNPTPTLSISGNFTICTGKSTTLTATGASNYTWSANSFNTSSIIVSPLNNSVYIATGSNSLGCVESKSVTVFVNKCLGLELARKEQSIFKIIPVSGNGLGFTIHIEKAVGSYNLYVHDLLGRIVQIVSVDPAQETDPIIENMVPGLYVITVQTDSIIETRKILLE